MALIGTLTDGVSALKAFTKDLEVIGNNISNVNTTAFKSSTSSFSEQFSNTLRASTSSTSSMQVGTGVALNSINVNYSQGALSTTGNSTDLGISGNGFFLVNNNIDPTKGDVYATRVGSFHWDAAGYLVNEQGLYVQGQTAAGAWEDPNATPPVDPTTYVTGPIRKTLDANLPTTPNTISIKSISFGRDGAVVESYSDGTTQTVGKVLVKQFSQPSMLMSFGKGLYTSLQNAGPSGGKVSFDTTIDLPNQGANGAIESGTLELSNVDLTAEFANMITAQRSFQANSRLVTVADNVLEEIVNLKR
jgi:flagellar hook protein FlgE